MNHDINCCINLRFRNKFLNDQKLGGFGNLKSTRKLKFSVSEGNMDYKERQEFLIILGKPKVIDCFSFIDKMDRLRFKEMMIANKHS